MIDRPEILVQVVKGASTSQELVYIGKKKRKKLD
jgi:hypothetical protein